MVNKWKFLIIAAMIIGGMSSLSAQKATEVYIPIGNSPGVSGKMSLIGTVGSVDQANMTITIKSDSETYTMKMNDKTRVWLDKTKYKEKNTTGKIADCKPGNRCEVKYVYDGDKRTEVAEWIKIEWYQ